MKKKSSTIIFSVFCINICAFLVFLISCSPFAALTQNSSKKIVAVYVSKKGIKFSSEFNTMIAAYVKADTELNDEDLTRAFAIQAGEQLTKIIKSEYSSPRSYFLNADPETTKKFLASNPKGGYGNLTTIKNADILLIVDAFGFFIEPSNQVFVFSNKLYTKQAHKRRYNVSMKAINIKNNKILAELNIQNGEVPNGLEANEIPATLLKQNLIELISRTNQF